MDLEYSAAHEVFRAEIQSWLSREVPAHGPPPPSADLLVRRAYDTAWLRHLCTVSALPAPLIPSAYAIGAPRLPTDLEWG